MPKARMSSERKKINYCAYFMQLRKKAKITVILISWSMSVDSSEIMGNLEIGLRKLTDTYQNSDTGV